MDTSMPRPQQFDPVAERPRPGESAAIASIERSMHGILETTWQDYGHAVRSVHAKSHGLLEGEFRVLPNLPPTLAQGLFARPATYPAVMRFSTNPGDILDDTVSSPRGLGLKVIGVEGERLPGSEADRTQDFAMVNGPAFAAPNAAAFAKTLKLLAATTDTGQAWKKALSAILRGAARSMSAAGLDGSSLKALGGHPMTHPLGETFYSQTPFRYGEHVAKFAIAPMSPELKALKDRPVHLAGEPNGLRSALIDFFRHQGATWEFRVQLQTDKATMPIEDATAVWPEAESPFVTVAEITVQRQPAWSEARAEAVDDGLLFSPWHGLSAHQPLGSVNRARKGSYAKSAGFRAAHNRCPIGEPTGRVELSGAPASVFGAAMGREGRRPGTPDVRPGASTQPMNRTARKITAGAIGGLGAGALLSVLFLALEAATDEPSDLIKLKRRTVSRAGGRRRRDRAAPGLGEQTVSHGGHLALSALSGALYGAVKPDGVPPLAAGAVFGAGFYAIAFGAVAPTLRINPKLTDDTIGSNVQHGAFHLLFGVATALIAERAARRL